MSESNPSEPRLVGEGSSGARGDEAFVLCASGKKLALVNLAGLVLGGALLWGIFRRKGSPGAFPWTFCILALWLMGDIALWELRGVRSVRVDGEGLEVRRGRKGVPQRIEAERISEICLHQRGPRRSLQILLGSKALRIPGFLTLYPGPKLWLTDDSFDHKEFGILIERLEALHGEIRLIR
ncbi:MAG TPA: hypothetical protein VIO60_07165 [Rectinemataceae bacterium]